MAPRRQANTTALRSAVAGLEERLQEIIELNNELQNPDIHTKPADEVDMCLEELQTAWNSCTEVYHNLCSNYSPEEREQLSFFTERRFDDMRKMYRESKLILRRLLSTRSITLSETSSVNIIGELSSNSSVGLLKRIDAPTFDGDRTQWLSFRESFTSLVINTPLSKIDKFNYLKNCLKGTAQEIIKGILVSVDSFDSAWAELSVRFDNCRLLKQAHADSLLLVTPVARANDCGEYERVLNQMHGNLMSLKGLGVEFDTWGELLLSVLKSKFDGALLDDWETSVSANLFEANYNGLKKFVLNRIESKLARSNSQKLGHQHNTKDNSQKRTTRTHTSNVATCPDCKNSHNLYNCPKFKALDVNQRLNAIRKYRVCYNCLHSGHIVHSCPSKRTCFQCSKKHHSLLHISHNQLLKRPRDEDNYSTPPEKRQLTSLHVSRSNEACSVILATAKVRISALNGREFVFRALIDQGSESSFISQAAVQSIGVKQKYTNVQVMGIGGTKSERVNSVVAVDIRGLSKNSSVFHLQALVMSKLTSHSPRIPFDIASLPHIAGLTLADDDPAGDQPIDVILGAEVFSSILQDGVRRGKENEPIAQKTTLGWILSGRISQNYFDHAQTTTAFHITCVENLDRTLRKFWEIENVTSDVTHTPEEQKAENIFQNTVKRRADGRYIVKIPFKSDTPDLGESRYTALQCYKRLEARLNRNPEVAKMYNEFLSEYLKLGHMAPEEDFRDEPKLRFFLPHHPVIRASSTTTKLRVVFNASARSSNGNSLNDCMYVGPKLHSELFDILLRWRTHKFVCSADMEKMFRQIHVTPEDTAFQCIFWKPPDSETVQIFRLNTVTYGTASAPYLSMRVLHQLADDEYQSYPNAAIALKRDVYVDDALIGCDTIKETKKTTR